MWPASPELSSARMCRSHAWRDSHGSWWCWPTCTAVTTLRSGQHRSGGRRLVPCCVVAETASYVAGCAAHERFVLAVQPYPRENNRPFWHIERDHELESLRTVS